MSKRRCLRATPCQHSVLSTRRRGNTTLSQDGAVPKNNDVVPKHDTVSRRCRVNTTSFQYGGVTIRHRVMSCQNGAVQRRRRIETAARQHDTVPKQRRFNTKVVNKPQCQQYFVSKLCRTNTVPCHKRCCGNMVSCQNCVMSRQHRVKATA